MKKAILLSVAVLAACISSSAQLRLGAGYLHNTVTMFDSDVTASLMGNGCYAGASLSVPVGSLFFEPAALLDFVTYNITGDRISVLYARVPLHMNAYFDIDSRTKILLGAGPGLSAGLFGEKDVFDGDGRFDIQAGVEGGFVITDRLEFRAGYDWGLLDRSAAMFARRRGVHAGVTFLF